MTSSGDIMNGKESGLARKMFYATHANLMAKRLNLPVALLARDVAAIVEPKTCLSVLPGNFTGVRAFAVGRRTPKHERHSFRDGIVPWVNL